MDKIGMVVATDSEIPKLLNKLSHTNKNDFVLYRLPDDNELIIVISQPGRENAVFATERLLSKFDVDYILNIGFSGGAYDDARIGDLIVANKARYMEKVFDLDDGLIRKTEFVLSSNKFNYRIGEVQTFDDFVFSKIDVHRNVFAVDMESYHIAKTASEFHKKTLIVRCISDILSKKDPIFIKDYIFFKKLYAQLKTVKGFKKSCLQINNFFNKFFNT